MEETATIQALKAKHQAHLLRIAREVMTVDVGSGCIPGRLAFCDEVVGVRPPPPVAYFFVKASRNEDDWDAIEEGDIDTLSDNGISLDAYEISWPIETTPDNNRSSSGIRRQHEMAWRDSGRQEVKAELAVLIANSCDPVEAIKAYINREG